MKKLEEFPSICSTSLISYGGDSHLENHLYNFRVKMGVKKEKKENIWLYIAIGFIIFLTTFVGSVILLNHKQRKTYPRDELKQIVFLGDSNIAFRRNDTDIPELVGKELGMTTYNAAMGGTTAARIDNWGRFDSYYEKCCLYELSNMIIADNMLPAKDNMEVILGEYDRADKKLALLSEMNFTKVDYLVLNYGMNDFLVGIPVDNSDNPIDDFTYAGALRKSIKNLKKEFPDIKIIIGSVTYFYAEELQGSMDCNYGGGTMYEYRDAAGQVAEEYEEVYFLDNLTLLGINSTNWKEYMSDVMHLNEKGQQKYADNLMQLMREIENEKDE